MGSFALVPNKSQTIMKVLLLVALAIAAVVAEPEAEADSAFVHHGGRYYGHPWGGYYAVASVATNENRIHGDFVPKAIVPAPATHIVGKREAEAEPEADADAWYGHYYGHPWGGYYGYPYRYGYYGYGRR